MKVLTATKYLKGDGAFYKRVLAVAIPMMVQNGINNVVSLLDNVMVGKLGQSQVNGVTIVNQFVFVFFLCMFGAVGGAGIFGAQFYGQRNYEGVKNTFRFKVIMAIIIVTVAMAVMWFFQDSLISLYLHDQEKGDPVATLNYGKMYLGVILIGLIPCAVENCYSSTLRECGQTVVPMVASFFAVFLNLVLNYVLIYGKFGAPALGIIGAAIATNVSRYVQMILVVAWTHFNIKKAPYMAGVWRSLSVPASLMKKILIMATPLIINETLWSMGIAVQNQIYSLRGLDVVTAFSINSAIYNVFNIAFMALGNSVGIIVGQMLGVGKMDEARDTAYRIICFSAEVATVIGVLQFFTAPLFPQFYEVSDEARSLATSIMQVAAVLMPVAGILHATYFTIRSGGKTFVTFLFDSVFLWVVAVPVGFVLTRFTGLNIVIIYFLVGLCDLIKIIVGSFILKSGVWMNNVVNE